MKNIPELKIISDALKSLKIKGIIRSNNLVGDLGEYYCKELFDIKLSKSKVEKSYDGIDNNGKLVQIKTRKLPKHSASIHFRDLEFDYCIYIELDDSFKIVELRRVNVQDLKEILAGKNRLSANKIKNSSKSQMLHFNDR